MAFRRTKVYVELREAPSRSGLSPIGAGARLLLFSLLVYTNLRVDVRGRSGTVGLGMS